jgi:hypothetical protein
MKHCLERQRQKVKQEKWKTHVVLVGVVLSYVLTQFIPLFHYVSALFSHNTKQQGEIVSRTN